MGCLWVVDGKQSAVKHIYLEIEFLTKNIILRSFRVFVNQLFTSRQQCVNNVYTTPIAIT